MFFTKTSFYQKEIPDISNITEQDIENMILSMAATLSKINLVPQSNKVFYLSENASLHSRIDGLPSLEETQMQLLHHPKNLLNINQIPSDEEIDDALEKLSKIDRKHRQNAQHHYKSTEYSTSESYLFKYALNQINMIYRSFQYCSPINSQTPEEIRAYYSRLHNITGKNYPLPETTLNVKHLLIIRYVDTKINANRWLHTREKLKKIITNILISLSFHINENYLIQLMDILPSHLSQVIDENPNLDIEQYTYQITNHIIWSAKGLNELQKGIDDLQNHIHTSYNLLDEQCIRTKKYAINIRSATLQAIITGPESKIQKKKNRIKNKKRKLKELIIKEGRELKKIVPRRFELINNIITIALSICTAFFYAAAKKYYNQRFYKESSVMHKKSFSSVLTDRTNSIATRLAS